MWTKENNKAWHNKYVKNTKYWKLKTLYYQNLHVTIPLAFEKKWDIKTRSFVCQSVTQI